MQELVKIIHHILSQHFHNIFTTFSQHTSSTTNINIVLCDRSSTNLSQHYHKLFIEYFNKFQQVSTRWMSIDFLLQLIQQHSFTFISTNHDTILYQYFNNILHRQSIFHFSTFLHHIFNKHSTNSYKAFFATFFATFFTTNWWCIISTNIQRIFLRNDLANYSSQTFQQTIWYISTSQTFQQTIWYISTSQTFTIGELVIELHHIFIMIKWQVFNNIFKWLFTTFIQQTLTTIYDTIVHYIYFNELQ